jgi:hypothetical protein
MKSAQEQYVEDRQEGHYNPLTGGMPVVEDEDENKIVPMNKKSNDNPNPNSSNNGRPLEKSAASEKYGVMKIKNTIKKASSLLSVCEREIKSTYDLTELNEIQESLAFKLIENVVSHYEPNKWNSKLKYLMKNPEKMTEMESNAIFDEVLQISDRHKIDIYQASLLYHSKYVS